MTCGCCWQAMDGSRCNIDRTAPAWTINGSAAEVWLSTRGRPGFWSPAADESMWSPVTCCWLSLFDKSVTESHATSVDKGRRCCNLGDSDPSTARECSCLQPNNHLIFVIITSPSHITSPNHNYKFVSLQSPVLYCCCCCYHYYVLQLVV